MEGSLLLTLHLSIFKGIRKIYVKTSVTNKPVICFWIVQNYKFEARMLDFSLESYDDYYLGKEI